MSIKEFLWILPFSSFLIGYFSLSFIYHSKKLEAPTLIGKSLPEAVVLASSYNLNLRLLDQQTDTELPEGTIIAQNPKPHTAIKPNQTLFCVTSTRPVITAPALLLKSCDVALAELKALGIHGSCYELDAPYPKSVCFAQSPRAHMPLATKSMILYVASKTTKPVLFPNLKNKPVCDVIEFLQPYSITPSLIHYPPQKTHSGESHVCDERCIVTNQQPRAGSLVTLDPEKPLQIQLQVCTT